MNIFKKTEEEERGDAQNIKKGPDDEDVEDLDEEWLLLQYALTVFLALWIQNELEHPFTQLYFM